MEQKMSNKKSSGVFKYQPTNFNRSPRKKIFDKVSIACEELLEMGDNVTVRAVRNYIGTGSHSTLSKYIKLWRHIKRMKKVNEMNDYLDEVKKNKIESEKFLKEFSETTDVLTDEVPGEDEDLDMIIESIPWDSIQPRDLH